MSSFSEYLAQADRGGFLHRRRLYGALAKMPGALADRACRGLWSGAYRHLRNFDYDFTFEREEGRLSSMKFRGGELARAVPLSELAGPIDRPVTVVAMGPSALEYDWEALRKSGRMIAGVSGCATFLREQGIVPDLLVVTDPDFPVKGGYHIRDAKGVPLVVEYRAAVSLQHHFPGALQDRPVAFIERVNRWYGIPSLKRSELERMNERSGSPFKLCPTGKVFGQIGWSDRVDLGFCPSSTVAFVALQILAGLGAREIEIVGMDLCGGRSVYASAGESRLERQYETIIEPSFRIMREVLAGREIRITNLSPVCPLALGGGDLTR